MQQPVCMSSYSFSMGLCLKAFIYIKLITSLITVDMSRHSWITYIIANHVSVIDLNYFFVVDMQKMFFKIFHYAKVAKFNF